MNLKFPRVQMINNNAKDIILKMLDIIGYREDKEVFANEFLKNVYLQSVQDLIKALPQEQQGIKDKIVAAKTPEELDKIVKVSFSSEDIDKALSLSSQNSMSEWIKTVIPTLSLEQKQKLQEYFAIFQAEQVNS